MSNNAIPSMKTTPEVGGQNPLIAKARDADMDCETTDGAMSKRKRQTPRNTLRESVLKEELARSRAVIDESLAKGSAASKEQLLEDRRAANRLSAYQSRMRRKAITRDLEMTVGELMKQQEENTASIDQLKKDIQSTAEENALLSQAIKILRDRRLKSHQHTMMHPPTQQNTTNGIDDARALALNLLAGILQGSKALPQEQAGHEPSFMSSHHAAPAKHDPLLQALQQLLLQQQEGGN